MPEAPPIFIVMGVAGTGKTTVGALLAGRLGWVYAEADDFHPPSNVEKMSAGQPLTDADRGPWLEAIGRWIDERAAAGEPGVITCSGLKRTYRDRLRAGRPQVRMVLLEGSRELITRRLTARHGHFMRVEMLDSQLADLELPQPDEGVTEVSIEPSPNEIVEAILKAHPDVR
ncbi:gluconokinase [Dactylosporangium sp. AC04546]|uniref:gluconokinase n=1 Tax=Dactylosporangium sp. AC04546 TaxID=2862460 RepID=UPI001EDF0B63|nr:gluconokinase [Dactylosporangium sp. AC04546]WVK85921.1 gluconokinase [Dactylosporangium sp. AC04546]